MTKMRDYKLAHMPPDGICRECNMYRGFDLKMWTLIPNHMYCKYCFIRNVGDKDEQRRLKDAFASGWKASDEATVSQDSLMLREILDIVRLLLPQQSALLNQQFIGTSDEQAREHLLRRLEIRSAPDKVGRYLIGPELEAKYGDRLQALIEKAPMSLMRGLGAVVTTPGIRAMHEGDPQPWVAKMMRAYTTDPAEYVNYPAVYVQALAKGA